MTVNGECTGWRGGGFLAVAILAIAAFFTRLLPLSISQYPFNNDSITECGIASEILKTGHLHFAPGTAWYGTHSVSTPVLDVVLAFFASALGVTPLLCAQVLGAVVAMTTVGGIFLLGRDFSGDLLGGVTAGLMALMFGTFVFTTGSIWKEMLGLSLFVLVIVSFLRRSTPEFRILTFFILLLMPYVHHLVAAVTFLLFAFLITWSWYFALLNRAPKRRYIADLLTVAIPGASAGIYYSSVSLDRLSMISTYGKMALLVVGFVAVCVLSIVVLSMKTHSKWTFAPIVGIGLGVAFLLDYSGLVFPYSTSASSAYLLLGISTAFIVSLAWYGTEIMLETKSLYRAIQVTLLMSPITIIAYGLVGGFSQYSHQILYRSFDFLDPFIFFGAAVGMVTLAKHHRRAFSILAPLLIVTLAVSFPFAYESATLLGVRHDTQTYEIDSLEWIRSRNGQLNIVSDERMGYVAWSTLGVLKDSSLPSYFATNTSFPPYRWFYVMDDSWTTTGVNNYPHGKLVISESAYQDVKDASNLFYVGGPMYDHVIMFEASEIGSNSVYGPSFFYSGD